MSGKYIGKPARCRVRRAACRCHTPSFPPARVDYRVCGMWTIYSSLYTLFYIPHAVEYRRQLVDYRVWVMWTICSSLYTLFYIPHAVENIEGSK